jgi:hypothetical protein
MTHARVRFQVCVWAAAIATALTLGGINAVSGYVARNATAALQLPALLAQGELIGLSNGATLR